MLNLFPMGNKTIFGSEAGETEIYKLNIHENDRRT